MIVYHGTTDDCREGIERYGLRPGSYVADNPELALEYAWLRAMTVGANSCVIFELEIPEADIEPGQSWWWAPRQLQLPRGCAVSCIVSVEDTDRRPATAGGD